jgi:hypothetical protein
MISRRLSEVQLTVNLVIDTLQKRNDEHLRVISALLRINETLKEKLQEKYERDDMQVGGTHYKDMAVQPWDVMQEVLTYEEFVGFLKGNVIKYSMRQGKKEGSDDGAKAQHYLAKLREVRYEEGKR